MGTLALRLVAPSAPLAATYNREWLLELHGYRTPIEARAHLAATAQAVVA